MALRSGQATFESFTAGADLSGNQFYILEAAGYSATVANAAADRPVGVLINKPQSGEAAQVQKTGIATVVSDGSGTAISAGDYVGPNTAGKAVQKATADFSVLGRAKEASSADGTIIEVDLDDKGAVFRTPLG